MNRRDFIRAGGIAAVATATGTRLAARAQSPIRVAQIGTMHSHAPGKWSTLVKLKSEFETVGIWEPDPAERAKAQGRAEYQGARWLGESEIFSDRSIKAVAVETELPDLLEFGKRAVEAGWHVHLDKPPGRDIALFAKLQEMAADRRLVLQHGYMFRYHPAFRFAIEQARAGLLGRILAIHGDIGSEMAESRRPWLAKAYGGSMMLLGSHLVDVAFAILGEPQAVTSRRRRSFPKRDDYYDNEVLLLEYPGSMAVIRSLNFEIGGANRRQFAVFGETGSIEIIPLEPAQVRLTLKHAAGGFAAGAQVVDLPPVPGRYDEMMRDFASMIRGAPSVVPYYTAEHDLAVHRAVLETVSK